MLDKPTTAPKVYSYIRLSSPEQIKGDGQRRQKTGAEDWAKKAGLPLDEAMRDLGVSAFTGDNVRTGALAEFIKRVEAGEVAPGSILVIEALDRLSRQHVRKAITMFNRLLDAGIDIVTLMDGRRYRADAVGFEAAIDIALSAFSFGTGNEESNKKSTRIGEAWTEKRRKAADHGTPMTSLTPGWIRLDKDTARYVVIKDRAKVLVQIFEFAADGVGKRTIARRLSHVETWGRGKRAGRMFYESYVHKLLCDRRVLGEFQPGTKPKGGVWTASGEPIPDFYPRVISDELWWRVRYARDKNKGIGGTGNPEAFRSLFRGLTFCGCCASKSGKPVGMSFVSKGKGTRGGHDKLVCGLAVRSSDVEKRKAKGMPTCSHTRRYRYADLERNVLFGFGKSARDLLGHENQRRGELEKAADMVATRITGLKKQQAKWLAAIDGDTAAPKAVMAKLASIEADVEAAEREHRAKMIELNATPSRSNVGTRLSELMAALKQRETVEDRRRLNEQLRRHIRNIVFTPNKDGTATVTTTFADGKTAKWFLPEEDAPDPEEMAFMKGMPTWPKTRAIADEVIGRRLEARGWLKLRRLNAGWRAGRLPP